MENRAAEISEILKDQIKNFGRRLQVSEVGKVVSVGEGIALRIRHRPTPRPATMVEFENGTTRHGAEPRDRQRVWHRDIR